MDFSSILFFIILISLICFHIFFHWLTFKGKKNTAQKVAIYGMPTVAFIATLLDFKSIFNGVCVLGAEQRYFDWLTPISINTIFSFLLFVLNLLIAIRLTNFSEENQNETQKSPFNIYISKLYVLYSSNRRGSNGKERSA